MNRRSLTPDRPGSIHSKAIFRLALFAVLVLSGLASAGLHAQSANSLFKNGQKAEARQDYDAAFDYFQKANAKNPKDLVYRTALYRVRQTASAMHLTRGRKLLQSGDQQGALAEFLHAAAIDPGNEAAQQEIAHVRQKTGQAVESEIALPEPDGTQQAVDSISAPVDLRPVSNEPLTLHMAEEDNVIYQAIGKAAGVNVLFDPDYHPKRIQVDLNNVSLLDALRIVGTMSGSFWHPVTSNTIFVAQNTRIKHTELDQQAVQTFYLSNAWQQNDLNDVQTTLRNLLAGTAKFSAVPSQNAIVMRGTPDELLLAQKLINDLDKARAEVVVDIAVMEVSKNWERTLGIAWPSSVGVALQSPNSTSNSSCATGSTDCSSTTTSPTLYNLAHLTANDFAVTVGSATLSLLLSDGNTKVLQSPRIRATGDQKATMKIGQRVPIATGSYQTGAATAVVSSLVNTQFQYQDVGVNIEMTPTVHFDHDVTLKIKIEISSEGTPVNISGISEPIFNQRVVDQTIRLREGEASILGGIQNNQETQSWSGIPGLSSIPLLKYVFGSKDRQIMDDEIVFVVVPHIVRSQELDQANLRSIDTGSGTSVELRRVDRQSTGSASAAAPPVHPTALERPTFGSVPGQSAQAAAPALLAQLSAAAAQNQANPVAVPPPPTPLPAPAPAGTVAPAPAPASTPTASFTLTAPATPLAAGASFQVPVVLNGVTDIASVPVQLQYDPAKLTLINVAAGSLLNRDGQAVALIHRDDGPGNVTVVAARPPGATGVSGSGVVCVLTFQAKAAGTTSLTMTRAAAVNSAQQQVPVAAGHVDLVVK